MPEMTPPEYLPAHIREKCVLTHRGWEIPLEGTNPAHGLMEVVAALKSPASTPDAAPTAPAPQEASESLAESPTEGFRFVYPVTGDTWMADISEGGATHFPVTTSEESTITLVSIEGESGPIDLIDLPGVTFKGSRKGSALLMVDGDHAPAGTYHITFRAKQKDGEETLEALVDLQLQD